MNSILKWLHKNESLVHMLVMLTVFYGLPSLGLAVFYPHLVEPLVDSALVGLVLVCLLFVSYRAASAVTEVVKNAVTRMTIEQIRDITSAPDKLMNDRVVDYSSPNTLVIERSAGGNDLSTAPGAGSEKKKKRGRPTAKAQKKGE